MHCTYPVPVASTCPEYDRIRNYDMARLLYEVTRQKGVPLDMATMTMLARFFGAHPSLGMRHASAILDDIRARGMTATVGALEAVIDVYLLHGCAEDTLPLIREMRDRFGVQREVRPWISRLTPGVV